MPRRDVFRASSSTPGKFRANQIPLLLRNFDDPDAEYLAAVSGSTREVEGTV
jgi:hypothetical protein